MSLLAAASLGHAMGHRFLCVGRRAAVGGLSLAPTVARGLQISPVLMKAPLDNPKAQFRKKAFAIFCVALVLLAQVGMYFIGADPIHRK